MKGVPKRLWIVLAIFSFAAILKATLPPITIANWTATSPLSQPRANGAAVMLSDGSTLFIGGDSGSGPLQSAEVFSPNGVVSSVAAMNVARSRHFAVVLSDGRVLVGGGNTTGGGTTNSAEIYDPSAGTWTVTNPMTSARANATAAVLQDGRVLIAGGDNSGAPGSTIEIYDPSSGNFTFAGTMSASRTQQGMAVLQDGRVLIVGGFDGNNALASSDIFDPASGNVSAGPALTTARYAASATTLLNGQVAVIGGTDGANDLASAEVFDLASGSFGPAGATLAAARQGHQAFLLPNNNNVLITGGTSGGTAMASAELFTAQASPADGSWSYYVSATGTMTTARAAASGSTNQANGPASGGQRTALVIVGGGTDASGNTLASTEAYGYPTLQTDASDYPPGSTVTISGSGFKANENVSITLVESPLIDTHGPYTVQADGNGNFTDSSFATDIHDVNVRFWLSAVGSQSGLVAQNTFTDSVSFTGVAVGTQSPSGVLPGNPSTFPVTLSFNGNGSTGCTVSMSVTGGLPTGATSLFSPNPLNNNSGTQSILTVTPNASTAPGNYTFTVQATAPVSSGGQGCSGGTFTANGTLHVAGPATHLAVTGFQSPITAGSSGSFTVTALDVNNNTAIGFAGTVNLSSSDPQATFSPSSYTFVAADNGTHLFINGATLKTAGTQSITASATGITAGVQSGIVVNAAAGASIVATAGTPQSAAVSSAFTTALQATVKDASNNPVSGVTVTFTAPASGASGKFANNSNTTTAITNASGVATASTFTANTTTGAYTVTASASGVGSPANFSLTNTAGTAAKFVVSAPANASAGTPFSVTVTAQDSSGNTATNYTGTAKFTLGTTDASATVPANYTFTGGDSGQHTFTNGFTLTKSGTQTVTATDTITASINGTTGNISVAGGTGTKLAFGQQPSTALAGSSILPAVTVVIEDQFGNTTASTANVSLAIGTNPSGGTLGGTTTIAAVNGTATFSTLNINNAGTGYTLAATSGSLTGAASNAFDIVSNLAFTSAAVTEIAGVCSPQITLQRQNSNGSAASLPISETVGLSASVTGTTFYSDAACATPLSSGNLSIAVNQSSASFFFKNTSATSPSFSLVVTATKTTSGFTATTSQSESVIPNIAFMNAPGASTVGQCSPTAAKIVAVDGGGNTIAPSANITVNLSTTSATGAFYSDSACTALITTATIPAGNKSGAMPFYKDATAGTPTLTATVGPASATVQASVSKGTTSAAVASSLNPSFSGQQVTFTDTVSVSSGTGVPTGTVQFQDGGVNLGSPVALVNNGGVFTAQLQTSALSVATHIITAIYGGDNNFGGSTSSALSQVVKSAATTTTISAPAIAFGADGLVTVTVAAQDPTAGTPTGNVTLAVNSGTPISQALVNGSTTFTITQPNAGTYALAATYAAQNNFNTSSAIGALQVNQATATLAFGTLTFNYDGASKPVTVMTSPANLSGVTVTYNGSPTAPTNAGSYSVSASLINSNYSATPISGTENIQQATPSVTWATPADITYGTALSATQLNATASVPGVFVYSPAAGAILKVGNAQTLSAVFTPADPVDFQTVSSAVQINVLKATPLIVWKDPPDINYGTALGTAQLNAIALPPSSALTGWWKGDGDASDSAGGNNGTALGVTFPNGQINQAFSFAGSGDQVSIPYSSGYDLNAPGFTVEFWESGSHNASGPETILDKSYDPNANTGWTFQVDSTTGNLQFDVGEGSTTDKIVSTVDVLNGSFHYITGVWDGTKMELFVDGISQGSRPVSTPVNNGNGLTIGASATTGQQFQGLVDEVQIFRQAPPAGTYTYSPVAGTVLNGGSTEALSVTFDPTDTTDLNSSTASANINVTKASQTITFAALASQTYGAADFAISASSDSGLAVTFAPSGSCTVSGNMVHLTGAGSCTITASQGGDTNFNPASNVQQSFTIGAATLTVTGITVQSRPYNGGTTAALNFGSAALQGVVNGDAVTLDTTGYTANFASKNAGTGMAVTVTGLALSGAKAPNYSLTQPTGLAGDITAATLTLNVVGASGTYTSNPFTATCSVASGLVSGDNVTLTRTYFSGMTQVIAPVGVGSYTATCTSSGNPNYQTATAQASIMITPATVTITATDQNMTFGGTAPTFVASYSPFQGSENSSVVSGVTFTVYTDNSLTTAVTDFTTVKAGSYPIVASGAMAANYTFLYVNGTLTVNKATLAGSIAVTPVDPTTVAYGKPLTATVNLNSYSIGGVPVLQKHTDPNNPSDPTLLPESLTVYLVPVNGAPSQAVKFGTATAVPTYDNTTNTTGTTKTGWTATITAAAPTPGNYNAFVYGDDPTDHSLSNANLAEVGYFFPDTSDISYPILESGQIDVVAATVTVSFMAADKTYDGNNTATVSNCVIATGKVVSSDDVTCTVANGTFASKNASSSPQTVSATATLGGGAAANYTVVNPVTTTATISPATLTYTADPATRAYGAADPTFSGTVTGFVNNETQAGATTGTLVFATTADVHSSVGNYPINGSGLTAKYGNYNFVQAANNATALSITKAHLTVTADPKSRLYGDPNPNFTATISGFVNSETPTTGGVTGNASCTTTAIANSPVSGSPYPITCTVGSLMAGNYDFPPANFVPGQLTIGQRPITVVPNAGQSKVYGTTPDPALAFTVGGSGLATGDSAATVFTGALVRVAGENVGNYAISPGTLMANNNYVFTFTSGITFAITPAPLTITPDGSKTKVLGSVFTAFTGVVNGLKFSDAVTVTYTSPGAPAAAGVGSYDITVSNYTFTVGSASNYAITLNKASGGLAVLYQSTGMCAGDVGHMIRQPINSDGTSVFKQKSTVPVKFAVCDVNGNSIGTAGVVTSFRLIGTTTGTVFATDEAIDSTTPDTTFRWDPTGQQWIFNMNTKSLLANVTYYYTITLNDGSSINFNFGLK